MVTYFCNMANKLHWCSQQELIPTPGNLYIFCIECTLKLIANELELHVLSGSLQISSSIFKDVTLWRNSVFCILPICIHLPSSWWTKYHYLIYSCSKSMELHYCHSKQDGQKGDCQDVTETQILQMQLYLWPLSSTYEDIYSKLWKHASIDVRNIRYKL